VEKVDGAVDGIEYPPRAISQIGPAAFFAEESDVWRVLTKKVANELFDSGVDV
jgi:hypothetical protein